MSSSRSKGHNSSKRRKTTASEPASPSTAAATPRAWPDTDTSTVPFPSSGLLSGLDGAVWSALAHIPPRDFDTDGGKQVVIRGALNLIGMGWVATNTTAYRRAVGAKFDAAAEAHRANGWEPPMAPLPTIRTVVIEDRVLGEDGECHLDRFPGTEEDDEMSKMDAEKITKTLEKHGVAVVRSNKRMVRYAVDASAQSRETQRKGRIKIQHTAGNGVAGASTSYYTDAANSTIAGRGGTDFEFLQDTILSRFLDGASCAQAREKRKVILLKYGEGAENWAHRDGNGDGLFPYQATILLSQPGVHFTGGEFYVAKRVNDGHIVRTSVEFKNGGDMVIFQAANDGEYDHGMMKVKRGSSETCERVAVGLLQQR